MHWLDIVILVVVAVATFIGLRIGIIKAALSLTGLIVGVVLAGRCYAPLAERLTFIQQDSIANGVAYVIILIGVMIVASVIATLLKWAASAVLLGWVNHLGGAVFGLFIGAILCGALLTIWVNFLGMPGTIKESNLAVILHDRFPSVLALLPDEFNAIRSFFE